VDRLARLAPVPTHARHRVARAAPPSRCSARSSPSPRP
jgi:hypothetical protein